MKAMILAAGKGERLRPLTATTPKPLLAVGGKPLIAHHLQSLAQAGITEVMINTWYLGEQIVEFIGSGARFGLNVHYSQEDTLLDTGGGIAKCLNFFKQESFLVISADIFTNFNYLTLPTAPNGLAHLIMVDNPTYHLQGDFCLDKGMLKLQGHENKFTYANIGIFRPEFFAGAPTGAFPLRDLMFKHIAANNVTGQYFAGLWHNIGTPTDLALANQIVTSTP